MSFVIAPTRVFCTAVLGLLLAASSLLLPSSGPGSVASAIAPAPSAANCQNTAPLGMSGTWTCSFDDEFSGTSLDTTKWIPQADGEQWVHDRNDLGLALLRRQPGSLTIYRGGSGGQGWLAWASTVTDWPGCRSASATSRSLTRRAPSGDT